MHVPGLTIETIRSMEDVDALVETGKKNRSTFVTHMNEHSSRSHLVFSIYVDCSGSQNRFTGETTTSLSAQHLLKFLHSIGNFMNAIVDAIKRGIVLNKQESCI